MKFIDVIEVDLGARAAEGSLFVDPGDKPNYVDARLTQIRFRAEEIEGDIPERERSSAWIWWLGGTFLVVTLGVLIGIRWYQKRE